MKHSDVISIYDLLKRLPALFMKLPRILQGLGHVYDKNNDQKNKGLGWAFENATRKNPNGLAVQYRSESYTYDQFNQWANRLAHYFLSIGLQKGDAIILAVENRPELLALTLACAKIGCVAALINTSQTGKVLTHSLNLVAPKVVVVGEEMREAIEAVRGDLDIQQNFYWVADQDNPAVSKTPSGYQALMDAAADAPSFNPPTSQLVFGNDLLFYIYTSGTTGLPKAVVISHARWMKAYGSFGFVLNLGVDDVLYCTMPFYHGTAMIVCWASAIAGASTLVMRRKFSRSEFWNDCRRYRVTAIGYVGELCRYLMEDPPSPEDRNNHVRKMIGNGLRPNVWKTFKARFGIEDVLEIYGSSEGNVGFTNILNFDNTVGYSPVPYVIVKYDLETGQPIRDANGRMIKVKRGESGLLLGKISAKSPFDGYTDPEKTRAVILENVFEPGDRYFNTGDLMRDLGFRHAQFVDRTGDTFRWKGENVSTTEVENVLCDHPAIQEAVVYGVEIPETNGRAGMAALTLATDVSQVDFADIAAFFKQVLPGYAVPLFLRLQKQVEATGTFKYQKQNLRKHAFDPSQTDEPLLVLLPGASTYVPVTPELHAQICSGAYCF